MESPKDTTADITVVMRYNGAYLGFLSEKYGGDSTLNEIRVANSVFRAYVSGHDVGVSTISDELAIPKSTVSRAVSKLERLGWVNQESCSFDGRRRNVRPSQKSIDHMHDELLFLSQFWQSPADAPVAQSKYRIDLPECQDN